MKHLPVCAMVLGALLSPLLAHAAGTRTASFQVGITIVESCVVDNKAVQPNVNCAFNSPSSVQASPIAAIAPVAATSANTAPVAAPSKAVQQGQVWTVTF
jgi:hypothetical protein